MKKHEYRAEDLKAFRVVTSDSVGAILAPEQYPDTFANQGFSINVYHRRTNSKRGNPTIYLILANEVALA